MQTELEWLTQRHEIQPQTPLSSENINNCKRTLRKAHVPSSNKKSMQLTGFFTCKHFFCSPVSMSQNLIVSSYDPLMRRFPTEQRSACHLSIRSSLAWTDLVKVASCRNLCALSRSAAFVVGHSGNWIRGGARNDKEAAF